LCNWEGSITITTTKRTTFAGFMLYAFCRSLQWVDADTSTGCTIFWSLSVHVQPFAAFSWW
jgi:hypothetical protein